uniref:Ovule protein n=1 Tax=Meloidogyne hapla TaxID=6305 RepID=A0A1I8C047_MELHA
MSKWGLVQNALNGEYFLSRVEKLPEVFWVRVSKEKLPEIFNAVKNMEVVDESGGALHPFWEKPEDENVMEPIWKHPDGESMELEIIEEDSEVEKSSMTTSVPDWFEPICVSTPRDSQISMYLDNSSPELLVKPFWDDFPQDNVEKSSTTTTEFEPACTSTPRYSPVSMYYANSSPALQAEPYLADYLQEDESFF